MLNILILLFTYCYKFFDLIFKKMTGIFGPKRFIWGALFWASFSMLFYLFWQDNNDLENKCQMTFMWRQMHFMVLEKIKFKKMSILGRGFCTK